MEHIRLYPQEKGRKLNVHKTFRRRPGRLMYVRFTSRVQGVYQNGSYLLLFGKKFI